MIYICDDTWIDIFKSFSRKRLVKFATLGRRFNIYTEEYVHNVHLVSRFWEVVEMAKNAGQNRERIGELVEAMHFEDIVRHYRIICEHYFPCSLAKNALSPEVEFVRICRPLMAGIRLRTNFYIQPEWEEGIQQKFNIFREMCTEVDFGYFGMAWAPMLDHPAVRDARKVELVIGNQGKPSAFELANLLWPPNADGARQSRKMKIFSKIDGQTLRNVVKMMKKKFNAFLAQESENTVLPEYLLHLDFYKLIGAGIPGPLPMHFEEFTIQGANANQQNGRPSQIPTLRMKNISRMDKSEGDFSIHKWQLRQFYCGDDETENGENGEWEDGSEKPVTVILMDH